MAKEIERKFLVKDNSYTKTAIESYRIRQTYLSDNPDATVRIRVIENDGDDTSGRAWLTVKGRNKGAVRDEWEFEIPVAEAVEMAERLAGSWSIDKTRYIVNYGGRRWEVDEFHGLHAGLVIAEVELPDSSAIVAIPPFVGLEVTGDPRYYNSVLASGGAIPGSDVRKGGR